MIECEEDLPFRRSPNLLWKTATSYLFHHNSNIRYFEDIGKN